MKLKQMKSVFSFSLFGNETKYCKGLVKNITIIERVFPGWEVWVYCGDGISEDTMLELHEHPCVRLIPTNEEGMVNKFYRFFAIDDPEVGICIVRDADSRIYERDQACIHDFLQSEKFAHIIRDHPNHHHLMMAGMWGVKKSALFFLQNPVQTLFHQWKQTKVSSDFWSDTLFLCDMIYPKIAHVSIIHDELQHYEPIDFKTPFRVPLLENHFVGQVYEFDTTGQEVQKFSYQD
jgi:hypothetical protein